GPPPARPDEAPPAPAPHDPQREREGATHLRPALRLGRQPLERHSPPPHEVAPRGSYSQKQLARKLLDCNFRASDIYSTVRLNISLHRLPLHLFHLKSSAQNRNRDVTDLLHLDSKPCLCSIY
ncbi:hypothetical protein, partial [Porphyromonas endodontalis]|uniref:hypothetical protein n=1 Tax=Porphyromonas endodontalis TaxID=28124 RepID=UPI0028E67D53